jgi:hypothetical protein
MGCQEDRQPGESRRPHESRKPAPLELVGSGARDPDAPRNGLGGREIASNTTAECRFAQTMVAA